MGIYVFSRCTVLPKFEVEMKFDSTYPIKSNAAIKGKVCAK